MCSFCSNAFGSKAVYIAELRECYLHHQLFYHSACIYRLLEEVNSRRAQSLPKRRFVKTRFPRHSGSNPRALNPFWPSRECPRKYDSRQWTRSRGRIRSQGCPTPWRARRPPGHATERKSLPSFETVGSHPNSLHQPVVVPVILNMQKHGCYVRVDTHIISCHSTIPLRARLHQKERMKEKQLLVTVQEHLR